MKSSMANRKEN